MQCYTTHRDPQFFPNPDLFLPERWLGEPGDAMSPQAKAMYMPFSSGPRACLGKTLAMMELKLITATLVRRFQVRPAPETTEQSMAMKDHFIAVPKSGKCELIFSEAAPS
jgi:cytochrome P450